MFQLRSPAAAATAAVTLLVASLSLSSCGEGTTAPGDEPEVATLRLTVGAQVVEIDAELGTVTGGPIVIGLGNTALSATFLRDDGTVETIVTAADFRLEVSTDNAGVAGFTRAGAFNGALVGGAAGSTVLRFSLYHIEEDHHEFGPYPVAVTVQ